MHGLQPDQRPRVRNVSITPIFTELDAMPVLDIRFIDMHGRKAQQIALRDVLITVMDQHIHIVFFDVHGEDPKLPPVFDIFYPQLFQGREIGRIGYKVEMAETFLPVELPFELDRAGLADQLEGDIALAGKWIDLALIDMERILPIMVLVTGLEVEAEVVAIAGGIPGAIRAHGVINKTIARHLGDK